MVFSNLLANENLIGVDIGSKTIKIARAEITKSVSRITHVSICPTPPDSVKDGVVVNIPEVAAAIKFALRTMGVKGSEAAAAIAGPGVTVRQVQLPTMAEQVLRKSIHFEASKYISASLEDSIVEFEIVGPSEEEGQMDVTLVAAPKPMVDSRVAVLEESGLEPLSVDLEVFTILRSLAHHNKGGFDPNGYYSLLDIGASHTEINLVSRGRLVLTRTIPLAGDSISSAIGKVAGCNEVESEQRKHSVDMTDLIPAPPGTIGTPDQRAVQSLIDELLREIRRSINYYQSQLPDGLSDQLIDKMILTGGTSRLKGLAAYASSRLNIDVQVCDSVLAHPAGLMGGSEVSDEDLPLLAVAFGLITKDVAQAGVRAPAK